MKEGAFAGTLRIIICLELKRKTFLDQAIFFNIWIVAAVFPDTGLSSTVLFLVTCVHLKR